jgi:chromate transporter
MLPEPAARPSSPLDLFSTFTLLALQGFGGVLAVTQRELCERKRWLTHAQFVEILSIGQVLPGPNVVNVALIIGDRYFGWRGAFSALAGMMALPLVIVLALAATYVEFAQVAAVAGALRGMAAVAAGLIIGTALRLAASLRGTPIGRFAVVALATATFVAVALLRWPLVWVLLALGSVGMAWAWRCLAVQDRSAR